MAEPLAEIARRALRGVIDPETGRDILAMGLVYDLQIIGDRVMVTMTTTTRGCPLSEMLRMGAEAALTAAPGITAAKVRLTWDPPWTPDRMAPLD